MEAEDIVPPKIENNNFPPPSEDLLIPQGFTPRQFDSLSSTVRADIDARGTVSTPQGNFTLRNISASTGKDGWTIDIPKGVTGKGDEIKFLQ